jgi:hypothetical protein
LARAAEVVDDPAIVTLPLEEAPPAFEEAGKKKAEVLTDAASAPVASFVTPVVTPIEDSAKAPAPETVTTPNDPPVEAAEKEKEKEKPVETKPAAAPAAAGTEAPKTGDAPKEAVAAKENEAPKAGDAPKEGEAPKEGDAPKEGEKAAELPDVPDVIPPPPVPTPEDLAKRQERAKAYQSLGEKFFKFPVTGSLSTRYRFRSGGGESDQDIYELLSMSVGDKSTQAITGHIDARLSADLDSTRTGLRSELFSSIVDTYNSPVNARLYSAYADFHRLAGLEVLRVGRQWTYETPEVFQFDGVRVDTDSWCGKHELKFSFYGGVPVHQFDLNVEGDYLVGSAVEGKPWNQARLRLDYVHADDRLENRNTNSADLVVQSLHPSHGTRQNDLVTLSFWQTLKNPNLRLQAQASALNGGMRDAMVRAVYNKQEWRLQLAATYRVWFDRQGRLANEFDYFFDTLAGQEPYHTGSLVATKGWTENFWMDAGLVTRRLTDASETMFNREFDRYYTTLQIRDLPVKGLTFSLTGSRWDGKDHGPTTSALGGDITYDWQRKLQTSIGTDYAMYKYDFFTNKERDQVRSYYLRQRWKATRWATLDVKYELERTDGATYNTLSAHFRFDF